MGSIGFHGSEDVGVAADHFFVDPRNDVGDVEASGFPGDIRVEQDLEEEVAEFFDQFVWATVLESIEDFVSFLNQVRF